MFLLQSTICRTSSLESRIRNITKEALNEAQNSGNACACGKPVDGGCRKCLMEAVCRRLQGAGFDSAICKSKWKSSPDIPSGNNSFYFLFILLYMYNNNYCSLRLLGQLGGVKCIEKIGLEILVLTCDIFSLLSCKLATRLFNFQMINLVSNNYKIINIFK